MNAEYHAYEAGFCAGGMSRPRSWQGSGLRCRKFNPKI